MPERKNSRDEFSNRLAELDLVGSREPSFSDYVNFQSESLRDVQDIEMFQYQGMERLSENLPAHWPQRLVEHSAPKSDGCFEHSLVHKPLPRSLKVQESARWWVDFFGCCPPVGRIFSGIFSYNDNTANEVVATDGRIFSGIFSYNDNTANEVVATDGRIFSGIFSCNDNTANEVVATDGARVLGFDILDPHGVTSTLVPLLDAEGRNV